MKAAISARRHHAQHGDAEPAVDAFGADDGAL
jgi:hypothetical protein